MKRRQLIRTIGVSVAAATTARAAEWNNSFAKAWRDSFLRHWRDEMEYTLAVLEAMPADGFGSRPHAAQRTFGEQMVHLARANVGYFTAFNVIPPPETPQATDKNTARAYVNASFNYVAAVLEKITEKDLLRTDLGSPPRYPHHSGTDLCLRAYTHTAHHRGQAVVYLRVKGIVPPAWKFEPTV